MTGATPTHTGQGAYLNSAAGFVDREAIMTNSSTDESSSVKSRKKRRAKRKRQKVEGQSVGDPAATELTSIAIVNMDTEEHVVTSLTIAPMEGELGSLSDANGFSDWSADELDRPSYDVDTLFSEESMSFSRMSSELLYASTQSSATPSDFSDVAYTLSSCGNDSKLTVGSNSRSDADKSEPSAVQLLVGDDSESSSIVSEIDDRV